MNEDPGTTAPDAPPTLNPQPAASVSGLAFLAFFFSIGVCPIVTLAGPIIGYFALRDIRKRRAAGRLVLGRTPAILAIVLGIVLTPLTTAGIIWWQRNVRTPMIHGPLAGFKAGQSGDVAAFEASFCGGDEPASPKRPENDDVTGAAAAGFLSELARRYGTIETIVQDDSRQIALSDDGLQMVIPYLLNFEQGTVPGRGSFVLRGEDGEGRLIMTCFEWFIIEDAAGELAWPPGATGPEAPLLPPDDAATESAPGDSSAIEGDGPDAR